MRSFLLQQLTIVLSVAGLIVGAGLLVKGHTTPGGGFVAGLSYAMVVVLLVAGRGTPWFRSVIRTDPESVLLVGTGIMLLSAFLPVLIGHPALTQHTAHISLPLGIEWSLHSSLAFDLGVGICIATGLASAILVLWERLVTEEGIEP